MKPDYQTMIEQICIYLDAFSYLLALQAKAINDKEKAQAQHELILEITSEKKKLQMLSGNLGPIVEARNLHEAGFGVEVLVAIVPTLYGARPSAEFHLDKQPS